MVLTGPQILGVLKNIGLFTYLVFLLGVSINGGLWSQAEEEAYLILNVRFSMSLLLLHLCGKNLFSLRIGLHFPLSNTTPLTVRIDAKGPTCI